MTNIKNKHENIEISTLKLLQVILCWMCASLCAQSKLKYMDQIQTHTHTHIYVDTHIPCSNSKLHMNVEVMCLQAMKPYIARHLLLHNVGMIFGVIQQLHYSTLEDPREHPPFRLYYRIFGAHVQNLTYSCLCLQWNYIISYIHSLGQLLRQPSYFSSCKLYV
jgi:hypothetical protein